MNLIEFSGFGRIVAGQLFKNDLQYNGYTNELDFAQESLLAAQVDGKLTDKLSATVQVLLHSSDSRSSGVEWAYFTYQHSNNLQFKLGKLRTPFFSYSDVIDVGFAYPWVHPPNQVYSEYLFSTFEGLNATYNFSHGGSAVSIEGYWGKFSGEVFVDGIQFEPEVDKLHGLVFNLSRNHFAYRLSYHKANVASFQEGISDFSHYLSSLGYKKSADSLDSAGYVYAIQTGLSYDSLDYFAHAEWRSLGSDILVFPESKGYYLTVGYNFSPLTAHFTYANQRNYLNSPVNEIPTGVNPDLDMLNLVYRNTFNYLITHDVKSYTLGLRYDLRANIAVKADISLLEGDIPTEHRSSITNQKVSEQAGMLQVGFEWMF